MSQKNRLKPNIRTSSCVGIVDLARSRHWYLLTDVYAMVCATNSLRVILQRALKRNLVRFHLQRLEAGTVVWRHGQGLRSAGWNGVCRLLFGCSDRSKFKNNWFRAVFTRRINAHGHRKFIGAKSAVRQRQEDTARIGGFSIAQRYEDLAISLGSTESNYWLPRRCFGRTSSPRSSPLPPVSPRTAGWNWWQLEATLLDTTF